MFTKKQITAINNFLSKKDSRQFLRQPYIDPATNKQYFCDSYRLIELNSPINDITNDSYFNASKMLNEFRLAAYKTVTVDIEDIKATYKNNDDKKRCLYQIEGYNFNCKYLIDLLAALPTAKLMLCRAGSITDINNLLAITDEATAIILGCRKVA